MYTNLGDNNSGSFNSGNNNSGSWNRGHWNSGHNNSGDWNSGNHNTGDLNTNTPKFRIFNKEADVLKSEIKYPKFFYNLRLSENKTYKESWEYAWYYKGYDDIELLFNLPNFDPDIFKEITGIDTKELYLNWKETN